MKNENEKREREKINNIYFREFREGESGVAKSREFH